MRDGRRKRLGLQEGTEGTVGDTYLDRILTDAEAAANPYTIAADTDVNFDTRDFRNISDTYNYYYGGGFDTAQDDATPPSSGDGGSGDGGTGGGTTPTTGDTTPSANTPEEQRLIDEGIGLQIEPGSPVFAPGEAPVTQEEIDAFNQIPVNQNYDLLDSTYNTEIEDEIYEGPTSTYDAEKEDKIYKETPTYANTGDQNLLDLAGGEAGGADGVGIIDEVNMVKQPQTESPIYEDLDAQAAATDSQVADLPLEQTNQILQIINNAGDNIQGALTEIGKIPGAIVDKVGETVTLLGQKIDVGKTIASALINRAAGAPISLLLSLLPDDGIHQSTKAARDTGLLTGSNTTTKDKYGINTQTSFNNAKSTQNYLDYNIEQVEKLETALAKSRTKYDTEQEYLDMTTRMRQELADRQKYIDYQTGVGSTYDTADPNIAGSTSVIDTGSVDEEGLDIADQTDIPESTYDQEIFQEPKPTPVDRPTMADIAGPSNDRDDSPASSAPAGVDAGTADVQDYFDDYSYSPDNDSGSQANIDTSGDFAGKGTGASGPAGGGGGSDPGGSKGCVIATHAVNSGAFTKDTKREAVRWCVKNLHRKWWGEAVRRGYKYYGQKAIEQGKAKNHYQEFKDYVAFGTGKRRTLKTGWTFVYRTVQFFLKGLTL